MEMQPTFRQLLISIHALREEGDGALPSSAVLVIYFNPRPPRGGRLWRGHTTVNFERFQSTPSARRATCVRSEDQRK